MEETTLPRFSCLEYLYICSMKEVRKCKKIARRKQKKVNQPYHKVLMHFRRSTRHKLKAMSSSSSSRHWIDVRQGAGNRFPIVCGELLPERTHSPIIIISRRDRKTHTKEGVVVVVVRWLVFCCQRHARVPCPDSSLSIEKLIPDESTDRKLVQKCFIFKSSYTTRLRII